MGNNAMTVEQAIEQLRKDPRNAGLIRDIYLDPDVVEAAGRFAASGEFQQTLRLLGDRVRGAKVLDLGAGNGIASHAFAVNGASVVYALEPDPSDTVGRGAIERLGRTDVIKLLDAAGDRIPLPDDEVDIVYARQVLHHIPDLEKALTECARVMKPGAVLIATREHVADDEAEREVFLRNHPVHQYTGGENAYSLEQYLAGLRAGGLRVDSVLGPWESVLNAFPVVQSEEELRDLPRVKLERKAGRLGAVLSRVPGVRWLLWKLITGRRVPGRLFTFICSKPAALEVGGPSENMPVTP